MGHWEDKRESNLLDGFAHFYDTYECSDNKFIAVGSIEPQFYSELLEKLESVGCIVTYPSKSPEVLRELPSRLYKAINIETEKEIDYKALQLAHRWAHKRNLLHSFFIPL